MGPRWLCLCKCSGPYVGLITNGVLPTVNEFVMHWMLHPHPISLEAVEVYYVTLCKYHVVWCSVVWCGVPSLPSLFVDSVRA